MGISLCCWGVRAQILYSRTPSPIPHACHGWCYAEDAPEPRHHEAHTHHCRSPTWSTVSCHHLLRVSCWSTFASVHIHWMDSWKFDIHLNLERVWPLSQRLGTDKQFITSQHSIPLGEQSLNRGEPWIKSMMVWQGGWRPQSVHTLTPRTCDCVNSHRKGGLADMTRGSDLEIQCTFWIIQMGPI